MDDDDIKITPAVRAYLQAFDHWLHTPPGEQADGAADLKSACFITLIEEAGVKPERDARFHPHAPAQSERNALSFINSGRRRRGKSELTPAPSVGPAPGIPAAAIICKSCQRPFIREPLPGAGRPRIRCYDCSPRKSYAKAA